MIGLTRGASFGRLRPLPALFVACALAPTALVVAAGPAADLNSDGVTDAADYTIFLDAFTSQDPLADLNRDGQVDFTDYLDFLRLYDDDRSGAVDGPAASMGPPPTELACYTISQFPHAATVDTFNNGDTVYFVADPSKLTTLPGITCHVYVTANRTWAYGDSLVDVRGAAQLNTFNTGGILLNIFPLVGSAALPFDAGEDIGVGYDIVIDRDNSGTLTVGDYIDGPGPEGGFYKIRDLTTANAGTAVSQQNLVTLPAGRTTSGFEAEHWYYPTNIAARGTLPLVTINRGVGYGIDCYGYLGQFLASYGYIVISPSVNVNAGIPAAAQTVGDHINTIIDLQATLGGGVLNGHIDNHRIVLIGHSRGGESVAYTYDQVFDGNYVPTGSHPLLFGASDIKAVCSMAPSDYEGTGATDPHGVPYHLIWGADDGDITGAAGNETYHSFNIFERATDKRSSTYIHGANHPFLSDCQTPSPPAGCEGPTLDRPQVQAIAKADVLAFLGQSVFGNIPCKEMLWRQYENLRPIGVDASVIVDREFKDTSISVAGSNRFVIDDMQTNPSPSVSSSGGAVTWTVLDLSEGLMRDTDGTFCWTPTDPMNGMTRARATDTSKGVIFTYDDTQSSWSVAYEVVLAGRNTSPYTYFSFRACQGTRHPATLMETGDQDFQVMLVDGSLNTSTIDVGAYRGSVEEPYCRGQCTLTGSSIPVRGWQNEFETCRIRLSDFQADGRVIDLTDIRYVYFLFGGSHGNEFGRIALDDIEWVRK